MVMRMQNYFFFSASTYSQIQLWDSKRRNFKHFQRLSLHVFQLFSKMPADPKGERCIPINYSHIVNSWSQSDVFQLNSFHKQQLIQKEKEHAQCNDTKTTTQLGFRFLLKKLVGLNFPLSSYRCPHFSLWATKSVSKYLISSKIVGRFGFSRYIVFALYLDIVCI